MENRKKMRQRRIEILVGLFVVLGFVSLAILSLQVATWGTSSGSDSYTLYAKFDNIGGLKPRSPVKIGGVVVGSVHEIHLDQDDWTPVVELTLDNSYNQLPETSSASILTSGLLGEQYVGITPGFVMDDIELLSDGDYLEDTKSAMVLEDLIGQYLFNQGED